MSEFGHVRQGFICPFCLSDLGDLSRLQAHVELEHPEEDPERDLTQAVVSNVKDLFVRARRGIQKLDVKMNNVDFSQGTVASSVTDLANTVQERIQRGQDRVLDRPPQKAVVKPPPVRPEIGITRCHRELFMRCRDGAVNEMAVRTNMLIIRLDRLINECPRDANRRREFEREVVPWAADNESTVCWSCASRFSITRRRHHCRLCGRVMCHACSRFFAFSSARKLTNPSISINDAICVQKKEVDGSRSPSHKDLLLEMTQKTTGRMKSLFDGAVRGLAQSQQSQDEVSLGSLEAQDANECLRVCGSCLRDLKRREDMMDASNAPVLAEQYATLDRSLTELASLGPSYERMANSLNNGETMYTLKAAEAMRQKVVQKQKEIDHLSQSIITAPGADEPQIGLKETQLRNNIRYVAVLAMQGVATSLVPLPTAEQYERLVEEHKKRITEQIDAARNIHRPTIKTSPSMPSVPSASSLRRSQSPQKRRPVTGADGWTPHTTVSHNPFANEEDERNPLYEQRDIIRCYLSEAAGSGRLEEVEMLERNLGDLEEEMHRLGLDVN